MRNHFAQFSELTQRLNTQSAEAWRVHEQALQMKQRGLDVVVLSIGDPDFRTPEPIIDNAISHMRVGRTHYSPPKGELNLRRAVADYETRVSPHPCQVEEVCIFPGVTAAIYAVMNCLLDPHDEVVLVDPYYVGYGPIMNALNAKVVYVRAQARHGFVPQFEELSAAVTERTKVMFLNTPSNPTGAIIPHDDLKALAEFCFARDIWLVCDEVYSMFTYEQPHVSLRTAATRLDNIVVIDGLSKSHAMSGWRMGWVVAPADLVHHLGNFAAMSTFGCPQFIQDASAFALNNDEYYVRDMCKVYQRRRDQICDTLAQIPKLDFVRPQSGMFVMVDVTGVDPNDTRFCQRLLDAKGLSLLPGSAFGDATRGHVRMSLVQPEDVLAEGCQRLRSFVQDTA